MAPPDGRPAGENPLLGRSAAAHLSEMFFEMAKPCARKRGDLIEASMPLAEGLRSSGLDGNDAARGKNIGARVFPTGQGPSSLAI